MNIPSNCLEYLHAVFSLELYFGGEICDNNATTHLPGHLHLLRNCMTFPDSSEADIDEPLFVISMLRLEHIY